jgi:hypothetical protein
MYLLEVRGDAVAALVAARRNWSVQREPADLCIYAQASLRAHSTADSQLIGRWLAETHYEDRSCSALSEHRAPPETQ